MIYPDSPTSPPRPKWVVVVTLPSHIDYSAPAAAISTCACPNSMIEPIRDQLNQYLQADRAELDERWVRKMSQQVQDAEVELVANPRPGARDPMRQIIDLKVWAM